MRIHNMPLFQQSQTMIERLIGQVNRVILDKQEAIEYMVIALLCGGHVLLQDVPGVGKTMLVRTLAQSMDCSFRRIQFTPDLLPSDVTGITIYNQMSASFEFRPGPIMANIILADEVNRTSPKTQSALLEAMEELNVTIDGTTHSLPQPFIILATQNPLDFEGTYRLPEAQLDRFMFQIRLGYPSAKAEVDLLARLTSEAHTAQPLQQLKTLISKNELLQLQQLVPHIYVDESLRRYIVNFAVATRKHPQVRLGISPRGSMALMKAAQGHALLRGRSFVIPDDIKQVLPAVFTHRLLLNTGLGDDLTTSEAVIEHLLRSLPVPHMPYVASH